MGNFMLNQMIERGPFRTTISFPRGRDGFHVMPTSNGYETAQAPGYDWDGRKRGHTPFSILQYTIAGTGHLRYERRTHRLEAGDAMLVVVPHDHRYWVAPGETWSFFWIAMSGKEVLRLHRTILETSGPVFRLRGDTIDELAAICLSLHGSALTVGRASSEAYRATMAIHDDLMTRAETPLQTIGHEAIDRAANHIRTHLDDALDIATLAAIAGLSRAHFSRVFARTKGLSPVEFIQRERMERAARLLVNGQLSVKAVATLCGFEGPNYFAKVFRRAYGISPSEFRTNGMYAAMAQDRDR